MAVPGAKAGNIRGGKGHQRGLKTAALQAARKRLQVIIGIIDAIFRPAAHDLHPRRQRRCIIAHQIGQLDAKAARKFQQNFKGRRKLAVFDLGEGRARKPRLFRQFGLAQPTRFAPVENAHGQPGMGFGLAFLG
jgi:hypothetical protein